MVKLKLDIPKEFFNEEERCGYVVSAKMKQVWAVELDLLSELLRVCEENNIIVFADSGTLLGAVRHGGFIPWDDDIDVVISRKDYIKLLKIGEKCFKEPYHFPTNKTDPEYYRSHAQLRRSDTTGILKAELKNCLPFDQGIFIDIFPMDNLPDDNKELKLFSNRLAFIKKRETILQNSFYDRYDSIWYKQFVKNIIRRTFTKDKFYAKMQLYYNQYELIRQKYNYKETTRCGNLHRAPIDNRLIFKRDWFKKQVYSDFEMIKIPIPIGYCKYLKSVYGDWKKFEIGTSVHGGIIFDTSVSYKEYLIG